MEALTVLLLAGYCTDPSHMLIPELNPGLKKHLAFNDLNVMS